MSANAPSSAHGEGLSAADREFQDHVFRIKTNGYSILRAVWPEQRCAAARSRLEALRDAALAEEGKAAGSEVGFGTGQLYNKGVEFEGVYQAERILRLVRHFLGDDAVGGPHPTTAMRAGAAADLFCPRTTATASS